MHRLALLPASEARFPDISTPNFVIATADDRLRAAITKRYDAMKTMYPTPAIVMGPKATA